MKKLELKINNCSECPYCRYDNNYTMSKDSGYDCSKNSYKRIIDDWEYNNTNNLNRLNSYSIPMPDWCPLPDDDMYKPIVIDEEYDQSVKKCYVNQLKETK